MSLCISSGRRLWRSALLLSLLVCGTGCYSLSTRTTSIDRDTLRTVHTPQSQEIPHAEGSLFAGESGRSLLFVDRKARQVNDVVTVNIVESATASGEATTATDRESSVAGSLDALFGFEKVLQNNGINPAAVVQTSLSSGFDGSGTTARKNSLRATITAVVREVFPNGNLYIEGTKEVVINNERQYIILSGVIRPEDIQTGNSITSNLIADARIVYAGTGALADKQYPGLLGRVLDFVWPF